MLQTSASTKRPSAAPRADRSIPTACQCIGRLAVQLSRERMGACKSVEELVADACAAINAADVIREALDRAAPPPPDATTVLVRLARAYHAEYVGRHDLAGMCCGFRFTSGSYTAGFENLYFLS